jgi:hypothetical protein
VPEELTPQERLETRLNRLEQEVLRENRWWRGGLIAALVLVALAILVNGHHHRRGRMFMATMGMPGWAGAGPEGMPGYGPYPPPPHPGFGWGGPCGPAPGSMGWGPGPWGPGAWNDQPRRWGSPGPQAPQGAPQPNR